MGVGPGDAVLRIDDSVGVAVGVISGVAVGACVLVPVGVTPGTGTPSGVPGRSPAGLAGGVGVGVGLPSPQATTTAMSSSRGKSVVFIACKAGVGWWVIPRAAPKVSGG